MSIRTHHHWFYIESSRAASNWRLLSGSRLSRRIGGTSSKAEAVLGMRGYPRSVKYSGEIRNRVQHIRLLFWSLGRDVWIVNVLRLEQHRTARFADATPFLVSFHLKEQSPLHFYMKGNYLFCPCVRLSMKFSKKNLKTLRLVPRYLFIFLFASHLYGKRKE